MIGHLTAEMLAASYAIAGHKGILIFDGDFREWPAFRANIIEWTSGCGYFNSVKIQRSLQYNVFDTVKGFLTFADNAPTTMKTLQRRSRRPDLISSFLINDIRAYPSLSSLYILYELNTNLNG